jgi:hypothetical protein
LWWREESSAACGTLFGISLIYASEFGVSAFGFVSLDRAHVCFYGQKGGCGLSTSEQSLEEFRNSI